MVPKIRPSTTKSLALEHEEPGNRHCPKHRFTLSRVYHLPPFGARGRRIQVRKMFVELVCPHCGQPLRMPESQSGRNAQCGTCQGIFSTKSRPPDPVIAEPRGLPPHRPPNLSARPSAPHRGGLILALAIVGWLICPVTSVVAWVMGQADLKKMKAMEMDPAGEGLTKAGVILAIVQLVVFVLATFVWVVAAGVAIGVNVLH